MIFYTLQGPKYKLEIHDDCLKLIPRGWWDFIPGKRLGMEWKLSELAYFQITSKKFIWGKLEWASMDGRKESFRFSTNAVMMEKIERYIQKLILKNCQKKEQHQMDAASTKTSNDSISFAA